MKDHVINFLRHDDASVRRAAVSTCSSLMTGQNQKEGQGAQGQNKIHNDDSSSASTSEGPVSNGALSAEQQKKRRRGYLASVCGREGGWLTGR